MNQTSQTKFHSNDVLVGELIKPFTTCKTHGALFDRKEVRRYRDKRKKHENYSFRCYICSLAHYRKRSKKISVERKRIKDAVLTGVQQLTGDNPVVKVAQKKVVNMFLSLNRSIKK